MSKNSNLSPVIKNQKKQIIIDSVITLEQKFRKENTLSLESKLLLLKNKFHSTVQVDQAIVILNRMIREKLRTSGLPNKTKAETHLLSLLQQLTTVNTLINFITEEA